MESKWIIWTFVPMLNWAGWIHAGIRAKYTKYFIIAALYGIPFMLAMIFSEGNDNSSGQKSKAYNAVMNLQMLAWIGGIIHAQVVKKEVELRIKYAGQSAASAVSWSDGELERKIAAEYGVEVLPPNPAAADHATHPQMTATVSGADLSFVEWYTIKFDWFVTQPMPWSIVLQSPLWLFYGFIWIPLWYALSDKKRTGIQPYPTIQQRAQQQPTQTPPFVQEPALRTVPPPPTSPPSVPPPMSAAPPYSSAVDVNNAAEQDIAALPGIGPILAKKVIKIRQTQGGFDSIEQFAQGLGLKPHVVEQIRLRVVIGPYSTQLPGVVKKSSGRVVDF